MVLRFGWHSHSLQLIISNFILAFRIRTSYSCFIVFLFITFINILLCTSPSRTLPVAYNRMSSQLLFGHAISSNHVTCSSLMCCRVVRDLHCELSIVVIRESVWWLLNYYTRTRRHSTRTITSYVRLCYWPRDTLVLGTILGYLSPNFDTHFGYIIYSLTWS